MVDRAIGGSAGLSARTNEPDFAVEVTELGVTADGFRKETAVSGHGQFGVSQFTTWHAPFEDDLSLWLRLGVPAIEACERKLGGDEQTARRQLAMLGESSLTVSSVQPLVHALFPDTLSAQPSDPTERMARFRRSIDRFTAALPDQPLTFVTITGAAPGHDVQAARATAVAEYRGLARYAADRGCRVAFEPEHPTLMNVDTFVCTLHDAVELCAAVGSEAFGLMLDLWHLGPEAGVAERLPRLAPPIFGVQVADFPPGGPRALADRLVPGDGVLPLGALVAACEASGYDGAYCLEIFSDDRLPDSLWRADPATVITRSWAAFAEVRRWCGPGPATAMP